VPCTRLRVSGARSRLSGALPPTNTSRASKGRSTAFRSPGAVAKRVRLLEETGVITGYRAQVDARRAGRPLQAFLEIRCALRSCLQARRTAVFGGALDAVRRAAGAATVGRLPARDDPEGWS
jgi:hypothetical protein